MNVLQLATELENATYPNAYLYGNLDASIMMNQPTNLSGNLHYPDCYHLLQKSVYGAREAEKYGIIR